MEQIIGYNVDLRNVENVIHHRTPFYGQRMEHVDRFNRPVLQIKVVGVNDKMVWVTPVEEYLEFLPGHEKMSYSVWSSSDAEAANQRRIERRRIALEESLIGRDIESVSGQLCLACMSGI